MPSQFSLVDFILVPSPLWLLGSGLLSVLSSSLFPSEYHLTSHSCRVSHQRQRKVQAEGEGGQAGRQRGHQEVEEGVEAEVVGHRRLA